MALVKELIHQHIGSGPILKAPLQKMGFQSDPVSVQSVRELATESRTGGEMQTFHPEFSSYKHQAWFILPRHAKIPAGSSLKMAFLRVIPHG
jgi:hypothetical protein